MKKIAVFLFVIIGTPLIAQEANVPLATQKKSILYLKVGSTGISPEFSYSLNKKLGLRLSTSFYQYQKNEIVSIEQGEGLDDFKLNYDVKAKTGTVGLLLDYIPFKKFLVLNIGALYNLNAVDLNLNPKSNLAFNDLIYSPEEIGQLELNITYPKISPYAGITLGNAYRKKVRFLCDIGVSYTGSPKIEMRASGAIEPTASQSATLERNLKPLYLFPVIKLGLSYQLNKK
ncbi:MAG: hypothetical protein CFE21_21880 [Bacteroidetes bacterium B1(2017)]|nr:MAG: hypothetical protein CFE21_21880 [Bacteroidetes bacterium B1(2017)]